MLEIIYGSGHFCGLDLRSSQEWPGTIWRHAFTERTNCSREVGGSDVAADAGRWGHAAHPWCSYQP